jgi:arginine decarboxylase
MISRTSKLMKRRVLIVDDKLAHADTAGGRAVRELADEFVRRDVDVVEAGTYEDGEAVVVSYATVDCICLNWCLGQNDADSHGLAVALLRTIRKRNATIPVFLLVDQAPRGTITVEVMQLADETVWMLEDTATLIVGRAVAAMRATDNLVPPFTRALFRTTGARYSWAAPGRRAGARSQVAGRPPAVRFLRREPVPHRHRDQARRASSLLDPTDQGFQFAARVFGRTAAPRAGQDVGSTARSSAPSSARTSSLCATATATSRSSRA